MRCPVNVVNRRRVLCVFPAYTPSFGTFSHAYRLMRRVRAFMPPQGLLLIAAYLPESWSVRFIDENIAAAREADFAWADVVMVSGMHVQRPQIRDIAARAKAAGKVTVLGGASVSGAPDLYPEFDYLHIGEVGDGTEGRLIAADAGLESNVRFLRSYDEVVDTWRRCIAYAYEPERLFARFAHQIGATYPNRMIPPARGKLTINNLRAALVLAFNVAFRVGLLADYRRPFWRAAWRALRRGQIDAALGMGFIAHHLIRFTREALRGKQNASFYSMHARDHVGERKQLLRRSA